MRHFHWASCALLVFCLANAQADEITLIAPGGIRVPIQKMIPDFERKTGHTVKATFGSGEWNKAASHERRSVPQFAGWKPPKD